MRIVILAVVAGFLSGCGTTSSIKFDNTEVKSTSFVFADNRPMLQRISRVDENQWGTTTHYGDDNIHPSPDKLVAASLERALSDQLAQKMVSLDSFSIYVSEDAVDMTSARASGAMNSVASAGYASIIALPVIYGLERVNKSKKVTVEIRGKVGEKEYSSIVQDDYRGRVTESNIKEMIQKALGLLHTNVRKLVEDN